MSQTERTALAHIAGNGLESAETDAENTVTTRAVRPPTAPTANASEQRNVTEPIELCDATVTRRCACGCGQPVTDENRRGKRYVDRNHRQEAYRQRQGAQRRECIVCGTVFTSVNQKICSDNCRDAWREYRATLRHANGRTS